MIDIQNVDKAELLYVLYNNAKRQIAFVKTNEPLIDLNTAKLDVEQTTVFEQHRSKNLFIDITGDIFDPTKYNSYYGDARAEQLVEQLKNQNIDCYENDEFSDIDFPSDDYDDDDNDELVEHGKTFIKCPGYKYDCMYGGTELEMRDHILQCTIIKMMPALQFLHNEQDGIRVLLRQILDNQQEIMRRLNQ